MGCNIHGFIEVMRFLENENTKWWSVHEIPYTRNYRFYAALAGVRNYIEITPIAEPKGMPHDASMMSSATAKEDELDGHTHSWLTYKEIKEYNWLQSLGDSLLIDNVDINFKSLINEMQFFSGKYGEEGVRVVFWFDN